MTQIIEIEQGLVSLVERSVTYQIPLDDWMSKIEKRSPIQTPVLPTGTRAVYWDNTDLGSQKLTLLIEREPHIANINYNGDLRTLSIPWTRFFFYCTTNDPANHLAWILSEYRIFWAKTRYSDPAKTDMIPALLPNIYGDGRICFGSTGANADQTIADRLDQTINEFYVSQFNNDLTIRRPNNARSWREWIRMTAADPTGWMNWNDWDPNGTPGSFYSFDRLAANFNNPIERFSPMIAPNPIPEIPLGATFGRIQEWLDTLETSQRSRLLAAMVSDRDLNGERYEEIIEEDENENE